MPLTLMEQAQAPARAARQFPALRTAILLFLFLNCAYLLTSTGRARTIDEIDPVMQSESLLLRHNTAIPQAVNSGIWFGKADRHGIPRSAWPSGHSLLILPWSALGHGMASLKGVPRDVSDLVVTTATCWSNATYAALAAAAAFLLFLRLGLGARGALACSLLLAFATPLFVYSGWLYSEPPTLAIWFLAALLLLGNTVRPSVPAALAGSLLLAFSLHVRPANMVTVLIFIAAVLVLEHGQPREAGRFAYRTTALLVGVVFVSGLLYLARNYAYFGNPFDFGVPAAAENGKDLESWHNPFWRGVFGFLLSPGKSVFLFCPPLVLGILGVRRLWRRNRALTVLAVGTPLSSLVLYSFRTQWEGSFCYGPRYLLPGILLLCIPIAALMAEPPRWFRPAFWTAAIAGFAIQAIGLSVNVLEDMVANGYYNAHWDYQMGYAPIPGQLRLIWKYLHVEPRGMGLGWDRWFILLGRAGVNPALLSGAEALLAAGVLAFGLLLWRELKRCEQAA